MLDTLAAAHAEAGDFEAVVEWQKKAVAALPEGSADCDRLLARLKLYREKTPYREAAPPP